MSRLDELITELCPDGVEYKKLGEIGDFFGGLTGKNKNDFMDGNARYITYMNIFSSPSVNFKDIQSVKISPDEKQNKVLLGDILFTGSSESLEECGISSVVTECHDNIFLNSFCFGFRLKNKNILIPHFSKHLFRDIKVRNQIIKTANGVTRFNVSKKKMENVKIPVPPLPVQEEIVRILDKFTELTAELSAELTKRKQQYQYYIDALFNFSSNVEWKKIGDITRVFSASRVHKNEWTQSGVPFYRSSDIISFFNGVENPRGRAFISYELFEKLSVKSGKINKEDILITGGGTIGIPYIVPSDDPIYVKDADLICIQKNSKIKSKFLYYFFLTSKFRSYLENITHNATIAHYTISQIEKTPVPVPSLEVQEHIVYLVSCLDALCNDRTSGLPAEIEARKKQYEYYRDKLLTFKEAV